MEGRIIPLRVYFYLRLQARFNYNRVLTSVSMLIYCLTADEVTSSCSQILVSSPLLAKTFRLLRSMYRVTFGLYYKIILAACLSGRKMITANCLFLFRSRQLGEACLKFFPRLCSTFSLGRNWKEESVVTLSLRLKRWRNVVSMTIRRRSSQMKTQLMKL